MNRMTWIAAAVAACAASISPSQAFTDAEESLEVLIAGVDFEAGNRLRHCIDGLFTVPLGLGQIGEILALNSLICGVVIRHRWLPSVESQFTGGLAGSSIPN
jgi:hypothetical protein